MLTYLKDNNYAHMSEGALVVDVQDEDDNKKIPPCLLVKSDGATLYATTDLATIVSRISEYNADETEENIIRRNQWVFLLDAARRILTESLKNLAIEVPDEM